MDVPAVFNRAHITTVQSRFNDFDVYGHVNNTALMQYFDLGKMTFFTDALGPDISIADYGVVIVNINVDFFAPSLPGQTLKVLTKVERTGQSSFTLSQQLVWQSPSGTVQLKAQAKTVMVAFDPSTMLSQPLNHKLLAALSPWKCN